MNENLIKNVNKILQEGANPSDETPQGAPAPGQADELTPAVLSAGAQAIPGEAAPLPQESSVPLSFPHPEEDSASKKKRPAAASFMLFAFSLVLMGFFYFVFRMRMLPRLYLGGLFIFLLLVFFLILALTGNRRKKGRMACGIFLTLLFTAAFTAVSLYANKAYNTLHAMNKNQPAEGFSSYWPVLRGDNAAPFLLYISGIDSRDGMVDQSLSDVNILLAVNPVSKEILMVNTPRDYFVYTPVSGDRRDKLTHAGMYGINVSRDTLTLLYGLPIQYTFRLDFSGFKAIIDAMGGIDVYSDSTFTVEDRTFVEGMNHMTGYQALLFVRQRKGLSGGDRARGVHQMAVINALLDKMTSLELVKHFFPVMDAMTESFDTSLTYDAMASVIRQHLSDGGGWHVQSFSVSGTDSMAYPYSYPEYAYVMLPDDAQVAAARQLMLDALEGRPVHLPE